MAARSKALVYGRSPATIGGSNPTGGIDVCLLCVLSGRGLCDELITRPEESYRPWRVVVFDQETSWDEGGHNPRWASEPEEKSVYIIVCGLKLPLLRFYKHRNFSLTSSGDCVSSCCHPITCNTVCFNKMWWRWRRNQWPVPNMINIKSIIIMNKLRCCCHIPREFCVKCR
jgi:hypothetical protein